MAIQVKKFYKGFSTRFYEELGGDMALYNIECIKEDLLNEIFTVLGERVYTPGFGTQIPLMVFELNDASSYDVIRGDLQRVINNDPRVKLLDLSIVQLADQTAVAAIAKILYLEFNVTHDLNLTINSQ